MAHQTPSTEDKGKSRAESPFYITANRSSSQLPSSQTLSYFAATADSAAPYISPYPPTTASNPNLNESALPVLTSAYSTSPQASFSVSGIMSSASKSLSAVCKILAHASVFPHHFLTLSIIFILSLERCTYSTCMRDLFSNSRLPIA